MKKFILMLLSASTAFAGVKQKNEELKYPSISLNQENYISDNTGIFNPVLLLDLKPGHIICFFLQDGTKISGLVKKIEFDDNKVFKLFGESINQKNCGFGFVISGDAIFAGATVFRDDDKTYTITYDDVAKGYLLRYQPAQLKIQ